MSISTITINHLSQLKKLAIDLTDEQLSETLPVLNDATIGGHIRHILEFYTCLFNCVNLKHVNYDLRKRDKSVEVSTDKCVLTIDNLLTELHSYQTDFDLTLSADYGTGDSDESISVKTTFFRELLYNIEHLVHHMAIIKIGIQSLDSKVDISDDFGVAASTIRNKKVCAQ